MNKNLRNVAIVLFTDGKDVIVQERGSVSKVGEKYGFWGGQIEEGETPLEAAKREIEEEMGFEPMFLTYVGSYSFIVQEESKYKGMTINSEVFLMHISKMPKDLKIAEGEGVVKISLEEVAKGIGFPIGGTDFVKDINFLKKLKEMS